MAEKKKERTDAERRLRQCERLSRVIRTLRCIMGPGRWDTEALARELEVSHRTVHRIMQTLEMSGVPWYYCKESKCYRMRPGFKFPPLETGTLQSEDASPLNSKVLPLLPLEATEGEPVQLASVAKTLKTQEAVDGNGTKGFGGTEGSRIEFGSRIDLPRPIPWSSKPCKALQMPRPMKMGELGQR